MDRTTQKLRENNFSVYILFSHCRSTIMLIHSWRDECPSVTKAPGFPVFISGAKIPQKNLGHREGLFLVEAKLTVKYQLWYWARSCRGSCCLPFPCCMRASSAAERWDRQCISSAGCIQHRCKAASSGWGCGEIILEKFIQLPGVK